MSALENLEQGGMKEYLEFWDIDGNIRLPRPERTYFDNLSEEYKSTTVEQKLLDIAYCIWHGLSLYDEVKTTLHEHSQLKEHSIKECLLCYIEYLRSGMMKNVSYIILAKKLTTKQASDLLCEELFLRYRIPANGEPHYLATAHWDYKELEGKVDYTRPTTIASVPISEEEIRKINPWQSGYVKPNPSTLYDPDAQWLLVEDEQIIKKFNQEVSKEFKFELGMRPEPFNGNPLTSKVIILSLNPGYKKRVNNLFARLLQMVQKLEEVIKKQKDDQLKLSATSFFCQREHNKNSGILSCRDAHCMLDDWYWYDIFNKFREKANLNKESNTNDIIFDHVALVQYVGYLSISWKPISKVLPSQRFTRLLILYLALHTDVIFVVSRSEKEWQKLIGKEIWEKLENEKRLIHRKTFLNKKEISQTIRTQYFTKESFKDDGFNRIVQQLKTS